MNTLSIFNHKGGVGKTTLAYNIAMSLSVKGYRTILVDLDPQCSLSKLALNKTNEEIEQFYKDNITLNELATNLINLEKITIPDLYKINDNLFLLAGSLNVSDLDIQLRISLALSETIPATRLVIINTIQMFNQIKNKYMAEYMIFDLSPNIGALNEIILMNSDYFIVPAKSDYFCLQAINSLKKNLSKWCNEINSFNKLTKTTIIKNEPKLLGMTLWKDTNFWTNKIIETARKELFSTLNSNNNTNFYTLPDIDKNQIYTNNKNYKMLLNNIITKD